MTALAAAAGGGGMGSGTSSWPLMQRPPLAKDGSSTCDPSSVPAIMNYVSPETMEISTRRDLGGSDSALVGAIWDPTPVTVADARLLARGEEMTLERSGFELRAAGGDDGAGPYGGMDFCDQDRVVEEYYPDCERLVSDAMASWGSPVGSSSAPIACACAFDHNVRSSDRESVRKVKPKQHGGVTPQVQNPAGLVHADYTKVSAPRRLLGLSNPPKLNDVLRTKLISENRASLLDPTVVREALDGERRYAFVNVWRSIDASRPVANPPFACVDARTVSSKDLRTFKIHYADRVGENYFACPPGGGRRHSWYYYPDMTIREALLLKQWDSAGGMARGANGDGVGDAADGVSTFAIHSAFIDPLRSDIPPRKSIEVRCVVIWEKEI